MFRFDIIKKLGQGTYGKVQLGVNKETGQEVCEFYYLFFFSTAYRRVIFEDDHI